MRVIVSLFWSFLLVNMTAYVVNSMQGGTYNFTVASILSVVVTVLVIILGEALGTGEEEKRKVELGKE
ncbi:YjzD family protein [Priestia endophytica]|uniref:DUF2929 domain-containing protein n=2 Tax=Priestia endophytica TaxID=135735 RepID=A0A329F2C1_9BACI|nr:YjzD family protein [Priestia endophytica]KAB2496476.1 DUF2929 family protein [Priestia endophytica]KYG31153.1 hypothetical protein AZF06_05225 [Priestia endophytica]MBG9810927.1 DeoR family transcriptional regulator [Priestia endophytica]MBG9813443.1 DeoR family transcriptional regulator [Priestia endophytica]MCM3536509.1 YjzD family protein [Priestia endophytica]